MKLKGKYSMNLRRLIVLNVLLFSSLISQAGFADKAKNAISREFNSFEGIWIMLGLIGGGLAIYVIMNKVQKKQAEKEAAEEAARGTSGVHHAHHHRRHKHRVAKK
jgi:hypothetical protein